MLGCETLDPGLIGCVLIPGLGPQLCEDDGCLLLEAIRVGDVPGGGVVAHSGAYGCFGLLEARHV